MDIKRVKEVFFLTRHGVNVKTQNWNEFWSFLIFKDVQVFVYDS